MPGFDKSLLLNNRVLLAFFVSAIMSVYAYNTLKSNQTYGGGIKPGSFAARIFVTTFICTYVVSYILSVVTISPASAGAGSATGSMSMMAYADPGPPPF